MNTRHLLLLVFLGLVAWVLYRLAQPTVEAMLRATDPERWNNAPVRSGAPDPRDWETLVDLRGPWAFRIGDDPGWSEADVELANWDSVFVPAAWENEGYFGYDGFAWYRTAFQMDAEDVRRLQDAPPFLLLGRIDDADEVWFNGTFLTRGGRMPPAHTTASFDFRTYRIPPDLLRAEGPNVLSVRVFDSGLEGGILEGPVALAIPTDRNPERTPLEVDLAGSWRFRPGDDPRWAAPDFDDAGWDQLRVPAIWDIQGYDVDGIAWYRTTVRLTEAQAQMPLTLFLGTIDDLDETFVNGVRVGSTGDVDSGQVDGDEWLVERAYAIPEGVLRAGDNVIAVRVLDVLFDGGIYGGPVGLMTPEAYAARQNRRE